MRRISESATLQWKTELQALLEFLFRTSAYITYANQIVAIDFTRPVPKISALDVLMWFPPPDFRDPCRPRVRRFGSILSMWDRLGRDKMKKVIVAEG